MDILSFRGGVNLTAPKWSKEIQEKQQCVWMQNFRHQYDYLESIPGSQKWHGTTLGGKITAIMPYYDDQSNKSEVLVACEDKIYKKDMVTNEFAVLKKSLFPGEIFSSTIRNGVMYIASNRNGMMKYLGGNKIETVGTGATAPGNFRQVVYMKEIDRMFGISDDAILGQITWCDLSQPEIWDGASVTRVKLEDGERVEGAATLYGKLIIFCTSSVWIYYVTGNEENWKLEQAPTTIGCVAPNTIRKVGNEIWFLGESPKQTLGIYAFNGSTCKLLTDDIRLYLNGNPGAKTSGVNKNRLRDACAEVHNDLYTFTYAHGSSEVNNTSFDLDLINYKQDGTPAIYGPHNFGFFSSAVLDDRHYSKEFLMGDQTDGFVYKEAGTTFKSTNLTDGQLISQRFLSPVYTGDNLNEYKQFEELRIYFQPRGYFSCQFKYYVNFGTFPIENNPFEPVHNTGLDYNVWQNRVYGSPQLSQHQEYLSPMARGTSIQLELLNDNLAQRLAVQGFGVDYTPLYKTRKVQSHAI